MQELQQVQEVEVSSLARQLAWYLGILFEYRKCAAVCEEDQEMYWWHPVLISNSVVPLFNSCHQCLFNQKERQVPPNAIASGKDFGKGDDSPDLRDLEERVLGCMRTTVNTVELVSAKNGATSQWSIRGHAISAPHDGPKVLDARLPDVAGLVGTKVIFVGGREDAEAMCKDRQCK